MKATLNRHANEMLSVLYAVALRGMPARHVMRKELALTKTGGS
jgi:hypothetical protein